MSLPFDSASQLRLMADLYLGNEATCLEKLFSAAQLPPLQQQKATTHARAWVNSIRASHKPAASVTDLLSRFGLTSQEGLALMCLAEALLRIPDRATADALIRDKLSETHWNDVLGTDAPWAMNVAGWMLSITGKIMQLEDPTHSSPGASLGRLVSRLGQPVIREAIKHAMGWLADQFVMGETIGVASSRAQILQEKGVRYSFDMLGEGARTGPDADRYFQDYREAIDTLGQVQGEIKYARASGISIKLSALHSRYEMAQRDRVMKELLPRVSALCEQAASYNIPLTIDAEEADRLQLSLEVAERLLAGKALRAWDGLGFAVQAYQKRAPHVIDYLASLAKASDQRLHIRLVKGAYWDSEIKRAQERGLSDFPVFTRKAGTDVSYLACAHRMLAAGEHISPIFGTHNAMTVAHIVELAGDPSRLEFQRLHGMGEDLHRLMMNEGLKTCVYAPVGRHDVLLGYLVRRILENGANNSFVHRLLDKNVPVDELIADPLSVLRSFPSLRHPAILLSSDLYAPGRRNSAGLELNDPFVTGPLLKEIEEHRRLPKERVAEPSIDAAFKSGHEAYAQWSQEAIESRAGRLDVLADLLDQHRPELMGLMIEEGGKTLPDVLSEVREAVDFCRYYAMRARVDFKPSLLPGPTGERNQYQLRGRGVFVCLSPWNFPLAIFLGQVAAALVAGNAVIAKPAPQTPLVASCAARLIWQAGFPRDVFQLVTGAADVGAALVAHPLVAGVVFTGSTATAKAINRALAAKDGPLVPLIAETGGQNALIVDNSALPEQVVDDVVTGAFRSSGQRCSATRLLCLPEETADKILLMLKGAMGELRVGDPQLLATDVGPLIDKEAQSRLDAHVLLLQRDAKEIYTVELSAYCALGVYTAPQMWEIPSVRWLNREVFGPILHVVRYRPAELSLLLGDINRLGFGLTGGLHSRIASTVTQVERDLRVGNFYVNRSMIGAVVGSQPFGGFGLSGTGPKAGGPLYLPRFALEQVTSNNVTASGGNASLLMAASS